MSKRKIKADELRFLKQELQYLEKTGVLEADKTEEIEDHYEVTRISFTKTLLTVGSILIGAGILSFVASNWGEISKLTKFLFILGLYFGSFFTGYFLENKFPKTAKSFYYLGVIVFGAGIFLIGQMFHFGGDFQDAFLWWSLGILPIAWVLKDKWILLFSSLLILIYMTDQPILSGQMIPYWVLLWIAIIYYLNSAIGFSSATGFVNGLLQLTFLASILNFFLSGFNDTAYIYGLIYLLIGMVLAYLKPKIEEIYILLGYLVQGGAALVLSFGVNWPVDWFHIPFSVVYLLYLLFLIKKGSLLSIILLCMMIFRYYLDYTFDFLPKSLVFIIGGLLLLGFGFYFEKQRKKGGETYV
ncbi:DUF2157 domain-containing protein [Bacillus sp. B15-48]|uniref:DUF2157 domain-containing protein n=1 Tax=Bacillus sp. B15-48 TaxID=1548601 RepID=UPI00193F3E75|nr:DUF2157 domain-containing protein [Bacillus sp. B15-48]MBM4765209.1 DUF2157 domain-containing protein [Bacillus sp. B15-48]